MLENDKIVALYSLSIESFIYFVIATYKMDSQNDIIDKAITDNGINGRQIKPRHINIGIYNSNLNFPNFSITLLTIIPAIIPARLSITKNNEIIDKEYPRLCQ
ncbi:hypothetical protein SDC9_210843 [bioreactor metagenome]|uniref:Uncharacterized protein n=1 Tax=bioreactor metagenome TaxID=1076179 RepID=A0A645JK44_9ZZZZ